MVDRVVEIYFRLVRESCLIDLGSLVGLIVGDVDGEFAGQMERETVGVVVCSLLGLKVSEVGGDDGDQYWRS